MYVIPVCSNRFHLRDPRYATAGSCVPQLKQLIPKTDDVIPHSLTGLLSFMLSDEMTTGSVTTSDSDKRAYASRSHAWNLEQRRFKEAFPDVSPFSLLPDSIPFLLLASAVNGRLGTWVCLGDSRPVPSCTPNPEP